MIDKRVRTDPIEYSSLKSAAPIVVVHGKDCPEAAGSNQAVPITYRTGVSSPSSRGGERIEAAYSIEEGARPEAREAFRAKGRPGQEQNRFEESAKPLRWLRSRDSATQNGLGLPQRRRRMRRKSYAWWR